MYKIVSKRALDDSSRIYGLGEYLLLVSNNLIQVIHNKRPNQICWTLEGLGLISQCIDIDESTFGIISRSDNLIDVIILCKSTGKKHSPEYLQSIDDKYGIVLGEKYLIKRQAFFSEGKRNHKCSVVNWKDNSLIISGYSNFVHGLHEKRYLVTTNERSSLVLLDLETKKEIIFEFNKDISDTGFCRKVIISGDKLISIYPEFVYMFNLSDGTYITKWDFERGVNAKMVEEKLIKIDRETCYSIDLTKYSSKVDRFKLPPHKLGMDMYGKITKNISYDFSQSQAVKDDYLIGLSSYTLQSFEIEKGSNGIVYSLVGFNWKTKEVDWVEEINTIDAVFNIRKGPVLFGDKIAIIDSDGRVYIFEQKTY